MSHAHLHGTDWPALHFRQPRKYFILQCFVLDTLVSPLH